MITQELKNKIEDFLYSFSSAATNLNLYSIEHPITLKAIEKSFDLLREILINKPSLRISVIDERLFIEDEPLWRKGMIISNIAEKFKTKNLNSVNFLSGVEIKEFTQFIREFAKPFRKGGVEIHSTSHIKIGKLSISEEHEIPSKRKIMDLDKSIPSFVKEMEELKEIFNDIKSSKEAVVGNLKEMVLRFIKGLRECGSPLLLLLPFKSHEEYLYTHSINVSILSLAQAESLDLEEEALTNVGIAGLLHDIGKMFVQKEILMKIGILNKEEWEEVKKHPVEGAKLLMKIPSIPSQVVLSAYEHHIKFDGSGYPRKKYNGNPSFFSQLITISDFYDALRTERPYRTNLDHDEVLALMDIKSGTDFNPKLLANFILLF